MVPSTSNTNWQEEGIPSEKDRPFTAKTSSVDLLFFMVKNKMFFSKDAFLYSMLQYDYNWITYSFLTSLRWLISSTREINKQTCTWWMQMNSQKTILYL